MRRGVSIRALLLGAHAFVLFIPLVSLLILRVYDVFLLRQTEHQLMSESVVIGEAFRAAYLEELGEQSDDPQPRPLSSRPQDSEQGPFRPIPAQIDFGTEVLPRASEAFPADTRPDSVARRAGRRILPILHNSQIFNLTGVRVLDALGCVVATTRSEAGVCMHELREVAGAMRGAYTAVLRERVSDEPAPPLGDIRRRGKVRVFTALPVWSNGRVIGIVRASRTGLDAMSSLWANRRGIVWLTLGAAVFLALVSFAFSAAIAEPLRKLTHAARAVAHGAPSDTLRIEGLAPREVQVLERVLHKMARELEARADYVQDFASQVSHELKTPMTAIRGATELLLHADEMPEPDRKRFLGNILEDAHRMERLVSRLLELARLENERAEPLPEIDVGVVLQRILERYGDRVRSEVEPLPHLAIREEQFASVVVNLLENALRHGAGHPVTVRATRHGDRLRIEVHDLGPGVSEANRRRLFERFFTTERDQGGTGLGLATVKAIAEARGGRVSADFDHGTTFSVIL